MLPPPPPPRSRRTSLDACSLNPTAAPPRTRRKTSASSPTPTTFTPNFLVQKKSNSSPALRNYNCFVTPLTACSPSVRQNRRRQNSQMTDDEEDSMIYTSWSSSQQHRSSTSILGKLNARATSSKDRLICTTPGQQGAGETETEADEPPKHLPTSRKRPTSKPLIPPNTLQQFITPLLFEFSRLLSIVPAIFGTLYNLYHVYQPYDNGPERVDFAISALWAILTGYQCLCLATGLLARWRAYYPPLATLIRLLALQAICWPATHFTLSILGHEKRPVITWAVVGTTTCMSRSVQLWVTSNLWWEGEESKGQRSWRGGKWGGRRWDWREVGIQCMLPAGVVYFVMAWAEQLRREFSGC